MRVVFLMQPDGSFTVATDKPCEVIIVNDHCPNDRVYRLTEAHEVGADKVDAILRDSPVGHSGDARHAAVKHRILSTEDGKPHLRTVE